jgi:hypothetical protein
LLDREPVCELRGKFFDPTRSAAQWADFHLLNREPGGEKRGKIALKSAKAAAKRTERNLFRKPTDVRFLHHQISL